MSTTLCITGDHRLVSDIYSSCRLGGLTEEQKSQIHRIGTSDNDVT